MISATEPLCLEARNVWFSYRTGAPVLRGLDLRFRAGEAVALVGPNGSGKSTLLSCLSGVRSPDRGEVLLGGSPLAGMSRRHLATLLAVLPQSLPREVPFAVEELVSMGRFPYRGFLGGMAAHDQATVEWAMRETGTLPFRSQLAAALSGGELQRVFLAKTLCQEPRLLLLDEPTGSLDLRYQVGILSLVRDLQRELGLGVLAVLHDLNLAALFFERTVVLNEGEVVADGPPREVITQDLVGTVYGVEVRVQQDDEGRPHVVLRSPTTGPTPGVSRVSC